MALEDNKWDAEMQGQIFLLTWLDVEGSGCEPTVHYDKSTSI